MKNNYTRILFDTKLLSFAMLFLVMTVWVSANANTVRTTTNLLDATHLVEKREVVDSVKLNKMLADTVAKCKLKCEKYDRLGAKALKLKEYLGKEVPEELKPVAKMVVANYVKKEKNRGVSIKQSSSTLGLAISAFSAYRQLKNADKPTDVEKDFQKGKLSKKTKDVLDEFIATISAIHTKYAKKLTKAEMEGAETVFYISKKPVYTVMDTIPNQNHRSILYKNFFSGFKSLAGSDFAEINEGWDWLQSQKYKTERKSYPDEIDYWVFDSHPEYYVFWERSDNRSVYNPDGTLEYVYMREFLFESEVMNNILRLELERNAYDIKSTGSLAIHKIRLKLGLDKMTAAEKRRADQSAKNFGQMMKNFGQYENVKRRYGANSAVTQQAAINALTKTLSLPKSSSPSDSQAYEIAEKWMQQIRSDWKERIETPYKVERLSPTEFRFTLVDDNCVPTYIVTQKCISKKKFHIEHSITVSPVSSSSEKNDEMVLYVSD